MQTQIRDLKANLSKYGDLAHQGKRIIVTKNGKPWFNLIPHEPRTRDVGPLPGVEPIISPGTATAPIDPEDVPGWA